MSELDDFKEPFEIALRCLLMQWSLWVGDDEVRALDVAFDSFNTEICISLLTNREPDLEESEEDPFGDPWPVGSWRLTGINKTARHCFPDAADLVNWMQDQAHNSAFGGDSEEHFNERLKRFFFEVATSEAIQQEIRNFKVVASPFHIRVHWFFEQQPSLYFIIKGRAGDVA